jgi:hypothetical protein
MASDDDNFFSRWSRRKVAVRQGVPVPDPLPVVQAQLPVVALPVEQATPMAARATDAISADVPTAVDPPPTLDDAALLTPSSDFRRFVAPGVDDGVKNAALKKLFADPHFNVMDGLDTYIDDYNKPDPLPASWLRQMTQSAALGLFDDEKEQHPPPGVARPDLPPPATPSLSTEDPIAHEDADLRLQPHDAAGPEGAAGGAVADAGREH